MVIGTNVKELLYEITQILSSNVERASREAQLLLMAYLDVDELWLLTNQDKVIKDTDKLFKMVERRTKNEPYEYIVNKVSFYSEEFYIAKGALIPRPETELLIDEVFKNQPNFDAKLNFVEVGIGSGIISIMLALKYKNANFIATDISKEALSIAAINIEKFNLTDRIDLREGSLLEPVSEHIDYLVSNPPYIQNDIKLESNLEYEPQNALYGGEIGDEIVKNLLDRVLSRNIKLFSCEFGYDQKGRISHYLKDKKYTDLVFYKDLADFDRGFTLRL